jgi:hypothetical protein
VACNRPAGEIKSQDKLVEALSGASADAGSIPAASTSGFKPKMDRDNRYIPRVIENAESRVRRTRGRRFDFSPRQALNYNDHPEAIIEDFDRSDYGGVATGGRAARDRVGAAADTRAGRVGRARSTTESLVDPRRGEGDRRGSADLGAPAFACRAIARHK